MTLAELRAAFIVTLLSPHHANFRKRMRKRPRLHFLDTGLVCYLLGMHSAVLLERHPLPGAIFESFVVGELIKPFENSGREAPVFFWRDATGHELDCLIDLGDRQLPIENKSGLTGFLLTTSPSLNRPGTWPIGGSFNFEGKPNDRVRSGARSQNAVCRRPRRTIR